MLLIDRSEAAFIIMQRRMKRRGNSALLPYSEVLYCSEPKLMIRHLERVKLAAIRRQRTAGLAIGKRFAANGIRIGGQTLFRSEIFAADALDLLYSELVLLPV